MIKESRKSRSRQWEGEDGMREWKEFRLLDIAKIYDERRIPLSKMEREKRKGGYPYYGASGIIDYVDHYLFDGDYVLISEDGENLKTRQTPVAFKASGKFWVNNHAHIIQTNQPYISDLLVYFIMNLDLNPFLTGAVQPKLNQENLLSIPFLLPKNETEQRAIASVLSSLDDKIDLLHRQNKTLEAMAETLFRQWFVEEAEESWDEKTLSNIAEHKKVNVQPTKNQTTLYYYYSIPAFDDYKQPVIEIGTEIQSNKYQVFPNTILISKLNPRFPRVWAIPSLIDKNSICSTEFQVVAPANLRHYGFIYCLLKSKRTMDELIGAAGGTSGSHQRVKPEDIFNISFKMPGEELLTEFYTITREFWPKIAANFAQIRTIEKLRDTLLPKLMSGEVKIAWGAKNV